MFKVNKHKAILKNFHKIVSNRVVLFNDGDNDIIYTGTNLYGNRILACIMFEDDEEGFLRYLYSLVTELQYSEFMNRSMSFREIINQNETVILVDYSYSMEEIDYNLVSLEEIPEDFLPLKSSYCPRFVYEPTFNYSLSLEGGLADLHKSKAEDLSDVSTKFSNFLKSSLQFLPDIDLESNVYIEAHKAGSFKVNYRIEIVEPKQIGLAPVSHEDINSFLNDYFKYFFNQLATEDDDVFKSEIVASESFKTLEAKLENLYAQNYALPAAGVEHKLIDLFNHSTDSIREIDYNQSFSRLRFENTTAKGQEIPFGVLDEDFILQIEDKFFEGVYYIDEPQTIDEFPKTYKILVYKFSNESGKGGAYYLDEEEKQSKIILHAKGRSNYDHTVFTKSMDEGKYYEVKAIGHFSGDRLKKIVAEV